MEDIDLLADINNEVNQEPVTTGTRFANYLIDFVAFFICSFLAGIVLGVVAPEAAQNKLVDYLVSYSVYIIYYTILEGATNGRTLGKMITGTRAIKDDGSIISFRDAFMRSLCRIVPFEPFSAFGGYPWHDKWTNTKVVKNKKKIY